MPDSPGDAMSGHVMPRPERDHDDSAESSAGAHYRRAHGDAASWPSHDYEVYWDLARSVPFPDLGPGENE